MATSDKPERSRPKSRKQAQRRTKTGEKKQSEIESAEEPAARQDGSASGKATPKEASEPMRKGIYLSALIYVEGDRAPADDFNALTTSALRRTLESCLTGTHGDLTMTLKQIDVRNDIEIEDKEEDSGIDAPRQGDKEEEGKFQF
jgi:hypothetical protein